MEQDTIGYTAAALGVDEIKVPIIIDKQLPYAVIAEFRLAHGWSFNGAASINIRATAILRRVQIARLDGDLVWQVPDGPGTHGCTWTKEEYNNLLA